MKTITFSEIKAIAELYCETELKTDLFWASHPVFVYFRENHKPNFRLFRNRARKSTRVKPHKKDNGNTLMMHDVIPMVQHFIAVGVLQNGSYKVVP
jgi:hypothetical protein